MTAPKEDKINIVLNKFAKDIFDAVGRAIKTTGVVQTDSFVKEAHSHLNAAYLELFERVKPKEEPTSFNKAVYYSQDYLDGFNESIEQWHEAVRKELGR